MFQYIEKIKSAKGQIYLNVSLSQKIVIFQDHDTQYTGMGTFGMSLWF